VKRAPVAVMVAKPFELPVFDDSWKAKCRTCVGLELVPNPGGSTAMHCSRAVQHNYNNGLPCIAAREEGSNCGPKAALWRKA
jgi:hypothetical protein